MSTQIPVVDVGTVHRIGHDEAIAITVVANQRVADHLRRLDSHQWTQPTECPL